MLATYALAHHHTSLYFFFFFNDPATTEIYTLSLHDALPILIALVQDLRRQVSAFHAKVDRLERENLELRAIRSEEHTSELQSRPHLVCRLLLEKKKKKTKKQQRTIDHQRSTLTRHLTLVQSR